MKMISLNKWAKKSSIPYSMARKMFAANQIPGAIRAEDGMHVLVPENTLAPLRDVVECAICRATFPQITQTHLKTHNMTVDEYKTNFPDHPLVCATVSAAISAANSKPMTEEHKAAISAGRTGITPKNHSGLFKVGNTFSKRKPVNG